MQDPIPAGGEAIGDDPPWRARAPEEDLEIAVPAGGFGAVRATLALTLLFKAECQRSGSPPAKTAMPHLPPEGTAAGVHQ